MALFPCKGFYIKNTFQEILFLAYSLIFGALKKQADGRNYSFAQV